MNTYDLITICIGFLTLLSFIILTIRGKRVISNRIKYVLLSLVCLSFLSIIILNHYYESQIRFEIDRVNEIERKTFQDRLDSLSLTKQEKEQLLDSLKKAESELDEILLRIQKQEKIVGSKSNLIDNVKNVMQKTSSMIYEIETYNETIENSVYNKCRKGLTFSGETSLFTFQPPLNTDGEYLDFIIKFHDESIIEKIAVIYIEVHKKHDDGNVTQVYEQYYKPQKGINAFRLKNYFVSKDVEAHVGFFWKSDFGKTDYPRYEKVTYSQNRQ